MPFVKLDMSGPRAANKPVLAERAFRGIRLS